MIDVKFSCKPSPTNSDVIERLNELELLIYSSSYTVVNLSDAIYNVMQKKGELIILCDTIDGDITIKLPKANKNACIVNIKKISADVNTVTILPIYGETLDEGTEAVIMVQNVSIELISDNKTSWFVI